MLNRPLRLLGALLFLGLTACSGGGSSSSSTSGSTALLRFLQADYTLGALDWQVDSGGITYANANLGLVQSYQTVSAASHQVFFHPTGTTASAGPGSCTTPVLAAGSRNTLVLTHPAGSSTAACAFFVEPSVSAGSGQAVVVYHDIAGNAPGTIYPLLCAANSPPNNCQNQSANPLVNAATVNSATSSGTSWVQFQIPSSFGTTAPGIALSVAPTSSGTSPICTATANLGSGPALVPSAIDNLNTSNFLPFNGTDSIFALFIMDGANAGAGVCNVTITGTFIP